MATIFKTQFPDFPRNPQRLRRSYSGGSRCRDVLKKVLMLSQEDECYHLRHHIRNIVHELGVKSQHDGKQVIHGSTYTTANESASESSSCLTSQSDFFEAFP